MSAPPIYKEIDKTASAPAAVIVEGVPVDAGPIVVESVAMNRDVGLLPPTGEGYIAHKQHSSRILFPVAGHPDWGKGAYYHPCGFCCYVEDRRTEQCEPGTFFAFPLTLTCYIGTLCYQPCGWSVGQIPWCGDCPCSKQRVTNSFARDYPSLTSTISQLVLVPKGSRSACVFTHAHQLRTGTVPLSLASHPGKAIGKMYQEKKHWGPYSFIESELVDLEDRNALPVRARFDGEYIWIDGEDLVFDVAFWKYEAGNSVNFVSDANGTQKPGGGRSWTVNDDGTIALKDKPDWVLGL